jgi:hypothetical protein
MIAVARDGGVFGLGKADRLGFSDVRVRLLDEWMSLWTGELLVDTGCHIAAAMVVGGLVITRE